MGAGVGAKACAENAEAMGGPNLEKIADVILAHSFNIVLLVLVVTGGKPSELLI